MKLTDLSQLGSSGLVKCFGINWGYRKVFTSLRTNSQGVLRLEHSHLGNLV